MAGINDFPGFISNFTRGTTKDFYISMTKDGIAVDLTDCKYYVTFSDVIDPTVEPKLEIVVDPSSPLTGETIGVISDTQTFSLTAGWMYYSIRFVNSLGATYVIDMGKIKIYEAISDELGDAPEAE